MIPKEKAKELIDKYSDYVAMADRYGYTLESDLIVLSKKCTLIAVDEILNDYSYMQNVRNANSNRIHSRRVYWQEVKQEIEKL